MIYHFVDRRAGPEARRLWRAELRGGKAVLFRPNLGRLFALQLYEHGSGGEVYPVPTELEPTARLAARSSSGRSIAAVARHVLRSVSRPIAPNS